MKKHGLLDHPKFKKFVKPVSAGSTLFRQGEAGNTMFIVLEGEIELLAHRDGSSHIAGCLESGDFLGERAILGTEPHPRHYSARAATDATVLELSGKDLEFLKIAAPELMTEVMTRVFEVAAKRLSDLNFLIQGLRSTARGPRIARCVLYFARVLGKRVPQGTEFIVSPEGIAYYTGLTPAEISPTLDQLISLRFIERLNAPYFLLVNEAGLVDYI